MAITTQNLGAKFIRGFNVNPAPGNGTTGCMGWILRLVYEFWGFCIHGDNNLISPGLGSMANSQVTGSYINMPVGWESGSNVLIASGSDGTTFDALPYFNVMSSTPFSPNVVGKWLTMWKSGSTSTDDSIYLITAWLNSSSIAIDPTYGGTSVGPSGSVPQLTARTNINYRVIDYNAAGSLGGYATGQYLVIQFSSAPDLNPGSARCQAKLQAGYPPSYNSFSQFTIILSPSGSWDGTQFTGLAEYNYPILPETTNSGPGSGGWGSPDWFHNSGGGTGFTTIIAGKTFLICQAGGNFMPNGGSAFHIEIPQRFYPRANDPNLICAMNFGNLGVYLGAQVGYGFSHRWFPSPYDTTVRRWPAQTRCITGAYWLSNIWGTTVAGGNVNRWQLLYNTPEARMIMSDGILSLPYVNGQGDSTGNFSMARARTLTMRYTSGGYPYYMRIGDDNDRWIHAGAGVLWPWDNGIVSARPIFQGF